MPTHRGPDDGESPSAQAEARRTDAEIAEQCPWAVTGRPATRKPNIMTTLELESSTMEENNRRLQATYERIRSNEVRYQEYYTDDCDYLIVAFGP